MANVDIVNVKTITSADGSRKVRFQLINNFYSTGSLIYGISIGIPGEVWYDVGYYKYDYKIYLNFNWIQGYSWITIYQPSLTNQEGYQSWGEMEFKPIPATKEPTTVWIRVYDPQFNLLNESQTQIVHSVIPTITSLSMNKTEYVTGEIATLTAVIRNDGDLPLNGGLLGLSLLNNDPYGDVPAAPIYYDSGYFTDGLGDYASFYCPAFGGQVSVQRKIMMPYNPDTTITSVYARVLTPDASWTFYSKYYMMLYSISKGDYRYVQGNNTFGVALDIRNDSYGAHDFDYQIKVNDENSGSPLPTGLIPAGSTIKKSDLFYVPGPSPEGAKSVKAFLYEKGTNNVLSSITSPKSVYLWY